jgi:Sec-independent protein translocase protein TatA
MNFYWLFFIIVIVIVIVSGNTLEDLKSQGKSQGSLRKFKNEVKDEMKDERTTITNQMRWEGGDNLGILKLLKEIYKQIHTLETRVANIKYIQNEKITYDLLDIVTEFDLLCGKEMDYKSAYSCYNNMLSLYYQLKIPMSSNQLNVIGGVLINFKYLNTDYLNLKVCLFEIITTYVNDEIKLKELYDKYISKENILNLMKTINL